MIFLMQGSHDIVNIIINFGGENVETLHFMVPMVTALPWARITNLWRMQSNQSALEYDINMSAYLL